MVTIIIAVVLGVLILVSAGFVVATRARRGAAPPPDRAGAAATGVLQAPAESPPDVVQEAPATAAPGPVEAVEESVAEAPPELPEIELEQRPALRDRLGKARALFGGYLSGIRGRAVDEATFEEIEEALLLGDVGIKTTTELLEDLRGRVKSGEVERQPDAVLSALRGDLEALFEKDETGLVLAPPPGPTVWLFVGVNGVGKTTTIGKLAARESLEGRRVVLAAGDTFRAAAGEQLETWAQRAEVNLIRGSDGADPSSVIFDAVQHASARGADLVMADTAGRLHTKVNLMEELRKVRRVAERPPGQLTEVILVLDATTGQNGLVQARQFTEAVAVTGVALTKLDGTAKGGIVIAVRSELGIPIKLVGVGEGLADIVEFDPKEFVAALFE